ncbi:hypothetical protein HA050_10130 [Iodobacter sp. HSC-16F04]|uniref:DUF1311 domain-containing protein n=1 Tax=Iodobacter violaceini TaxID=3044271 RepID=A0ABX0KW91_9NEIS|nr:hypothetical protein [Iodobacter violacea]NHQ86472.1 hypothetical protein [Iodobacter violacea]
MQHKFLVRLTFIFAFIFVSGVSNAQDIAYPQANSDTKKTIFANPSLLQLDQTLSTLFNQVIQFPERASYRQSQKNWLKKLDLCKSDIACITTSYQTQIVFLQGLLHVNTAYQPDQIDKLAILDLKKMIQARSKIDPEFALENTLKSLTIKNRSAEFTNQKDDIEEFAEQRFPKVKPKGVSIEEWRALVAANIEGGGENGNARYTLVDLDADGHRDLIIDSYIGGTGLYSYISVLQQSGGKFVGAYTSANSFASEDENQRSYLYSLNGRGSNQDASLIRLRERTYFAYRSGHYGSDRLYLLRALKPVGKVPTLTLNYRYQFSIPKVQKRENGTTWKLNKDLQAALSRSLTRVDKQSSRYGINEHPLCPIPESVKEEDLSTYYGFGPGHYTFEIVADIPVKLKGQCYVAQVVNWFGFYSAKGGLSAQLWMRKPQTEEVQIFGVNGVRHLIGITTAVALFDGDEVN